MENTVTQVHNISGKELLNAIERIEHKLALLEGKNHKPQKHSVKDLAEHCGVAELTVRNWITEGKVKAKRLGRRIFIDEEEFQRALSDVKSIKYQRA